MLCSTAVRHSNPEKDPVLAVISPYSTMGKSDENCGSTISGFDGDSVLNSNGGCCFNVTNISHAPGTVGLATLTSVLEANFDLNVTYTSNGSGTVVPATLAPVLETTLGFECHEHFRGIANISIG